MQVVFTNVMILFMLIFLGYYMGVKKIVAHSSIKDLTNILIDFAIPCTIIGSMIRPFSKTLMHDTLRVFIIMAIYHLGIAAISYWLTKVLKVEKKKAGSWIFALVFSNNGFIGYPLLYALYGNDGLFIMAMGNVIQNVLIFSIGLKIVNLYYNTGEKAKIRDIVFSRQNIAVIIGMIFFIGQIAVPQPVVKFITYIGNLTIPLSMLVVGLSLSRYNPKAMFTDSEVYRLTVIRMLIIPVIMLICFKIFHISANQDLPFAILFYTAALPSPAFTSILAERYDTSIEFASRCVFITTVLSVITVPVFAGFL